MEKEDREMLIRIDQKVIDIEKSLSDPSYQTIVEKVKTHGRLFWIAITVSITAAYKSFLGN